MRLFKLGPRQVGLDDAFVLGAWLAAVAVTVGIKLQFSEGFGWHAADIATLPNGAEILTRMIFVSLASGTIHPVPLMLYTCIYKSFHL